MTKRMSDANFKRNFAGENATHLYEEAKRAREAEKQLENYENVDKYLKHFNKTSLTEMIQETLNMEKENAELKAEIEKCKQSAHYGRHERLLKGTNA